MFLVKKILSALILPPTGFIVIALLGILIARSNNPGWRRKGIWLAISALFVPLILSISVVSHAMIASLDQHPPITSSQLQHVQAIVVLGGGTYYDAPEYGGDTVGRSSLERVRYGAKLARDSNIPLLVTGGAPFGGRPEADLMRETLENEFKVKVRWVESESRDTLENAKFSALLLKGAGVQRIALVSHSWHLPRAIPLFERQGFEVIPAPTAFSSASPSGLDAWLPVGIESTRIALNEMLGKLVYWVQDALSR